MLNLSTLKRQHEEIREIIADIRQAVGRRSLDKEASLIASKISMLAGKLKIHLNTEDRYMYPRLLQSENLQVRKIAKEYIDEMGHISGVFMDYKDRFNTKTKIIGNTQEFFNETNKIFKVLEERIAKEDSSLYTIL
jgi:hypothetical protein